MASGGGVHSVAEVQRKVLEYVKQHEGAHLTEDVQAGIGAPADKVLEAVQQLVNDGSITLRTESGGKLLIGLASATEHAEHQKLKGLSTEEKLLYQVVQQAGNKGVWIKDIRYQSNLPAPKVQKILKGLEARNVIKQVKLSAQASKKIYMLYELKPSEDLTGGQWYTDGSLDEECVEQVRALCAMAIHSKGELSLDEVTTFVKSKGFSDNTLQSAHVKQILATLVFDGTIDEQTGDNDVSTYVNLASRLPTSSPLNEVPCGQCPVILECADGNDVSPATCKYMADWLDF